MKNKTLPRSMRQKHISVGNFTGYGIMYYSNLEY